ncbi:MAG: LPS export ABC transporter periplasmic protein LptC [Candidatus Omnitrophica bacterium]|nr:LPS export ABC transporter periplasmic protein LptC [Candidatus Omnitrophota bacterium]
MISKKFLLIVIFLNISNFAFCAEKKNSPANETANQASDQQINDFSIAGYGERGKKSWDIAGKTADIFDQNVKLNDVTGNLYGKEEDIKLTADKGDFNKADGKVHLEDNVVITTTTGTKMTTDSLDWDRKNQQVSTPDVVNIKRDNMITVAKGAKGEPSLKKVALEKDVQVDILPAEKGKGSDVKEKITINCDGPLEIDYEKNIAIFNNNVKVEREDSTIFADRMDIYFLSSGKDEKKKEVKEASDKNPENASVMNSKIDKIIARGNVKVVRGENVSYSQEAIYSATDRKLVLTGRPKLILYSSEGMGNASFGN